MAANTNISDTSRPYKIGIVGPLGSGKTCWVRRVVFGDFLKDHIPTNSVSISKWSVRTSRGERSVLLYDFPGGCRPSHHNLDACILMLTAETIVEYPQWQRDPELVSPLSVAISKADMIGSELGADRAAVLRQEPLPKGGIWQIGSKGNLHLEKPLLHLMRQLEGDPKLQFLEEEATDLMLIYRLSEMNRHAMMPPASAPIVIPPWWETFWATYGARYPHLTKANAEQQICTPNWGNVGLSEVQDSVLALLGAAEAAVAKKQQLPNWKVL